MSTAQRRVSDYLQCELFHVLGAYRVTEERLKGLEQRIQSAHDERPDDAPPDELLRLTRIVQGYNADLARERHCARGNRRHPIPKELPLSRSNRFSIDPKEVDCLDPPWRGPEVYAWVVEFYRNAVNVLDPKRDVKKMTKREHAFSDRLTCPRDGIHGAITDTDARRRLRHARFDQRLRAAWRYLPELLDHAEQAANAAAGSANKEAEASGLGGKGLAGPTFLERIASANLSDGAGSLPLFVLTAQVEGHLSMHGVEALMNLPLGDHADVSARRTEMLNAELRRCITLDTFAYSVSRSAPWIFGEDPEEAKWVFEHLTDAWQNVVPTRCMWIGAQVSLLALHRRAYARSLLQGAEEYRAAAYNDYHKLQRLIRDTERRIKAAPIHVEGALEFLAALDAQAHHHIGELYRAENAQTRALRHFDAGEDRLAPHREGAMREVLTNSRWLVQLHVSRGKSSYELGRHKDSLCSYLAAWRAFLQLLAADTDTETSTTDIDQAIEWLTEVRHEPELRRMDVYKYVQPVVEQLSGITVEYRVGALAAEILLRLGHLLFVLNIGENLSSKEIETSIKARSGGQLDSNREAIWPRQRHDEATVYVIGRIRDGLAALCLQKAAEADAHSTLIGANLAKIRYRIIERVSASKGEVLPEEADRRLELPELAPIREHWPLGGDNYERIARVAEYLLLRALVEAPRGRKQSENAKIAEQLLLDFFTHIDSINVRKSQVHRFLTQRENRDSGDPPIKRPTIEFVCMRRYSSAFPLLPRPSAFHAHGGGYFVRLHHARTKDDNKPTADRRRRNPFGIAIDPGTDFVENLYRTGHSLSDIDLIVVTHDHVDHIGALDALLSLLHYRNGIMTEQYVDKPLPVKVIANRSVCERYAYASLLFGDEKAKKGSRRRDRLLSLEDVARGKGPRDLLPRGFSLSAMSSAPSGGKKQRLKGHSDLGENPSLGVCIKAEGPKGGASIAFTADVPRPRTSKREWRDRWRAALDADVLVAHLSTVPLTELRKMAAISANDESPRRSEVEDLATRASDLHKKLNRLFREGALLDKSSSSIDAARALKRELRKFNEEQLRTLPNSKVNKLATNLCARADTLIKVLGNCRLSPETILKLDNIARRAKALGEDAHLQIDSESMLEIRRQLEAADAPLQGRTEFSFWMRWHKDRPAADLLAPVEKEWRPPRDHPYLEGFLAWARAYRAGRRANARGLFIVGELSEELGTARSKVAAHLNDTLFKSRDREGVALRVKRGARKRTNAKKKKRKGGNEKEAMEVPRAIHALTADIGLRVLVSATKRGHKRVKVLCSTCSLDMDRVRDERFHQPAHVHEVCVKGENEGMFYNCDEHDPSQQAYPVFLEQLERFDVFGR